jgi:hypothetical protein
MASSSSYDELKAQGNAAFAAGRFEEAARAYTAASEADPRAAAAVCNRAAAFIKLGMWGHACADALRVMELPDLDPQLRVKALKRMAQSCVELGWFQQASNVIAALLRAGEAAFARELHATMELRKAAHEKRLAELRAGKLELSAGAHGKANAVKPEDVDRMLRLGAQEVMTTWRQPARDGPGGARSPEVLLPRIAALLPAGSPVAIRVGPSGFGVFATRDIARGEQVMVDSLVVAAHADRSRCHHCMADDAAVRCASPCRLLFCSPACQEAARALYHAPLCGADTSELDAQVTDGMTASSRFPLLAVKLLGMAMQERNRAGTAFMACSPADLPPVSVAWRMTDCERPFRVPVFLLNTWRQLRNLVPEGSWARLDPKLGLAWLFDVYAVLVPNAVSIVVAGSGGALLKQGAGLMQQGTFFNHSCLPNTEYSSSVERVRGPQVTFRAGKRIREGTELTISYVHSDARYNERQAALQGQYGFDCSCDKCAGERPAPEKAKPKP